MEYRKTPVIIVLSIIVLSLIAISGVAHVSEDLGYWSVRGSEPVPFGPIGRALLLGVVPSLAMIDLGFRRVSGRYLALLPMLVLWGGALRLFTDLSIGTGRYASCPRFYYTALTFGIVVSLAALILTLGFSKKVDAYLSQPPT